MLAFTEVQDFTTYSPLPGFTAPLSASCIHNNEYMDASRSMIKEHTLPNQEISERKPFNLGKSSELCFIYRADQSVIRTLDDY